MNWMKSCFVLWVALLFSGTVLAERTPIMLKVDGVGHMRMSTVDAFVGVGTRPAMCFDLKLLDMSSGEQIGTATDCMSEVVENGEGGMGVVATTTFRIPNGTATVQTFVAAQPVINPGRFVDNDGRSYTHMTGAIGGQSAVIRSSGVLAGISGTGRISGLLDMSHFNKQEGDIVMFNCLFEIYLD